MGSAILHTIRSMNPALGGPVEVVKQLTRIHREMGCAVEIASLDAPGDPWMRDSQPGIHALGEKKSTSGGGYGYSPEFVPWLREHHHGFSAVISHGLWQFNNAGVKQALRGTDTPYFVFPHGMLDPWFKQAYPLKHLKKSIYWLLRERHVLRDAEAVIFTCEEERILARQTFRPWHCNERVVTLGIAPPDLQAAERQRGVFFDEFPDLRKKRILLFLGRLHDKKGCDLLIVAFGKMSAGATEPFRLVIAGPCADESYLQKLRALAEKHCTPGSVIFPGMVEGDMKWGSLHAAEAFILPSHQENFGIAVVEALACAVPVLISSKVNIWREIEQDGAGIVRADDLSGTLALLESWRQKDDASRVAMGSAALLCFSNRFHIRKTAHELLALVAPYDNKGDSSDAPAAST